MAHSIPLTGASNSPCMLITKSTREKCLLMNMQTTINILGLRVVLAVLQTASSILNCFWRSANSQSSCQTIFASQISACVCVGDKTVVHIEILLVFFLTGMVLEGENSWRGREEYLKECQISNNRECMYYKY